MAQNKQHNDLPGASVDRLLKAGDISGAKAELEHLLREGMESGAAVEVTPQFWSDLRDNVHHKALNRRRQKSA